MTALKRLWVPVLVALLVAVLVGPVGVTAAEPRATYRTVTIPAAAFTPQDDDLAKEGYENLGYQMTVMPPATNGYFIAPLSFDVSEVTIRKMVLFAYDNGGGSVCVYLSRSTPANGYRQDMGDVCSTGAATGVRSFEEKAFTIRRITNWHGPYLELYIPGVYSSGYQFYGVRITYSY
jgi:hypothetical protein